MTDDADRLEIDWLKTVAGALAAVSSAFLLSTLGAAGTILGAALGSVVITVASALYSQGLTRSRLRMTKAQDAAARNVGVAQAEVSRAARRQGEEGAVEGHLQHAGEQLDEARDELDSAAREPANLSWRERLVLLPWKRIALLAAALFLLVVVVITAFELLAGRSLSSITGGSDSQGTTISKVTGRGSSDNQPSNEPSPSPSVTDSTSPTGEPSEAPTTASPSATPSGSPTESPSGSPTDPLTSEPDPTESPTG